MKSFENVLNKAFYALFGTLIIIIASMVFSEANQVIFNLLIILLMLITFTAVWFIWNSARQEKLNLDKQLLIKVYRLLIITIILLIFTLWPIIITSIESIIISFKPDLELKLDNLMLLVLLGWNLSGFWFLWKLEN